MSLEAQPAEQLAEGRAEPSDRVLAGRKQERPPPSDERPGRRREEDRPSHSVHGCYGGRPGCRAVTDCETMAKAAQIVERQRAVAKAMACPGGVSFHNVDALADEWGCSPKTIWADQRAIRKQWASEEDIPTPVRLKEWRAEVDSAIDAAAADGAHSAVLSGLALRAKVTGLEAPAKSEVKHTGGISIEGLSDEQAARLAAALGDDED